MNRKISKRTALSLAGVVVLMMVLLIVLHHNPLADPKEELLKKALSCGVLLVAWFFLWRKYDKLAILPQELLQNRRLIWKLSKNDFKKRYAGSYMGALWALVQPVVTVLMYWIVFEKVFGGSGPRGENGADVPFVLFLTAGLVPWFYFSEALTNGTNALLEYNYLVKKVVFKISILPIIKVISATFIHAFFILILLIVSWGYGYYPSLYTLQILYYSACLFIFVLALNYTTCALVVFFKDLSQIISIVLQIGMWMTPIMWNIDTYSNIWVKLLKLNPLVYIVSGYRSAIYEHTWFWQDFYSTMYFWIVTAVLFGFGALVFKRLKVHFADVL